MESNSDVSSVSTLEAQSIGTVNGTSFMMYKTEYNTFLLTVCLMYLAKVLEAGLEIFNW